MLRKLSAGQVLPSIPRDAYNAFVDAAQFVQGEQQGQRAGVTNGFRSVAIVTGYNDTGADLAAGTGVEISDARFKPGESDIAPALADPVVTVDGIAGGVISNETLAVSMEPIPDGKFGKFVVDGQLAWARVSGAGNRASAGNSGGVFELGFSGINYPYRVVWSADDDEGDPADDEGERWGLIVLGSGGGSSSDTCCERGTPVGVDSLNLETAIDNNVSMTRANTSSDYESSSFTLTGGDGTGTYKLVGDEEGDEIASGAGVYAMTIVLTYVSGSYSGYEATYRSAEPWATGGRDTFLLMPDGSSLADGTSVSQNLPDEEFPSSFCGVATA